MKKNVVTTYVIKKITRGNTKRGNFMIGHVNVPSAFGVATATENGLMSAADKAKLDGMTLETAQLALLPTQWDDLALVVKNSIFSADVSYSYVISPAPSSFIAYCTAGVYADDVETTGQITFYCISTPTDTLTVNVLRIS